VTLLLTGASLVRGESSYEVQGESSYESRVSPATSPGRVQLRVQGESSYESARAWRAWQLHGYMASMLAMESRVRAHPEEMVNVQVRRLL
jgi:hypothetical protein